MKYFFFVVLFISFATSAESIDSIEKQIQELEIKKQSLKKSKEIIRKRELESAKNDYLKAKAKYETFVSSKADQDQSEKRISITPVSLNNVSSRTITKDVSKNKYPIGLELAFKRQGISSYKNNKLSLDIKDRELYGPSLGINYEYILNSSLKTVSTLRFSRLTGSYNNVEKIEQKILDYGISQNLEYQFDLGLSPFIEVGLGLFQYEKEFNSPPFFESTMKGEYLELTAGVKLSTSEFITPYIALSSKKLYVQNISSSDGFKEDSDNFRYNIFQATIGGVINF